MAGQHLPSIESWDNTAALSGDEATWAHLLNAAGYETVLCSKMHFQGSEQMHGFQRRILSDCHGDWDLNLTANWSEWHPEKAAFGKNLFTALGPGDKDFSAYDEIAAAQASTYIGAQADSERPWALLVGLITPHFPFVARHPTGTSTSPSTPISRKFRPTGTTSTRTIVGWRNVFPIWARTRNWRPDVGLPITD